MVTTMAGIGLHTVNIIFIIFYFYQTAYLNVTKCIQWINDHEYSGYYFKIQFYKKKHKN